MSPILADLRSDTVTRPTAAMRAAMMAAPLGDDVLGDDPTVQALEAAVAARLGKEAALFVPSGTMANQLAIRLHTEPGDEVILEASAHPYLYEAGAAALISGVQLRPIPGVRGQLSPDTLQAARRAPDPHVAPFRLLCVEDTANRGGGSVHPLDVLDALAAIAHASGAATHLDGARLWNAAVASGIPEARRVAAYDTVSVCLSKGLGCPVGSLLAGPRALLDTRGRRMRKALGGGLRQSGLLAAAGLYALEHHIARLAEDHARAAHLAAGLQAAGFPVRPPETNMVYVRVADGPAAVAHLATRGVRCFALSADELRLVTHLDLDDDAIAHALRAFDSLPRP
jgi:threonine aldolase